MTGTAQIDTEITEAVAIVQDYIARGQKIAVYSYKINTLDLLAAAFTESGISFVNFRGSMPHEARSESVKTFNADDGVVSVFLASHAASEGVSLKCSILLNMEPYKRREHAEQRRGRLYRLGAEVPAVYEVSAPSETASEAAERFIAAKRALLASVLVAN